MIKDPINRIRKLDEQVINKIAAGEVITRPWNIVKELVENSLDAKATNITISVKDGGMKYIRIDDNGSGIPKEDLPLLCERHATSKISTHFDLERVSTYGFRGEALASMSSVAHLSVITMLHSEHNGYRAVYENCKLLPQGITHIASVPGTSIIVEDLFYNIPFRKKALKKISEEYSLILGIIEKYAIHFHDKRFVCKKIGVTNPDICSIPGTQMNTIRCFYGQDLCKHLIELKAERSERLEAVSGYISNSDYKSKKYLFITFINDRLVECKSLKKEIYNLYSAFLKKGAYYPFVYLSIKIDPTRVDVNAHPTKREVIVLNQGNLNEWIVELIRPLLSNDVNEKELKIQTSITSLSSIYNSSDSSAISIANDPIQKKSVDPSKLVRQKPTNESLHYAELVNATNTRYNTDASCKRPLPSDNNTLLPIYKTPRESSSSESSSLHPPKEVKLFSILSLRKDIEEAGCMELTCILSKSSYVGFVSARHVLLQSETKLYLADMTSISEELFRQLILYGFGNFNKIVFSDPIDINALIHHALKDQKVILDFKTRIMAARDAGHFAKKFTSLLTQNRNMIDEYFSIEINPRGQILALPCILRGYTPNMAKLAGMLLSLSVNVNWNEERECFDGISKLLASFYSTCFLTPPGLENSSLSNMEKIEFKKLNRISFNEFKKIVELIILPAIRNYIIAPKSFYDSEYMIELTNLSHLYKIFERC